MLDAMDKTDSLCVRRILRDDGWDVCVVPVSEFPVPVDELVSLRRILLRLTETADQNGALVQAVFLQFNQLSIGSAAADVADHGPAWEPALGLGVWPDREPPTLWTAEEMLSLDIGEEPRPLSYKVLRITGADAAKREAVDVMLSSGALLQVMLRGEEEHWLDAARNLLLPTIQERSFKCFPFYFPLLDGRSVTSAAHGGLDKWLCGASIYLRESEEDKGILVISKFPLMSVWKGLGAQLDTSATLWVVPKAGA